MLAAITAVQFRSYSQVTKIRAFHSTLHNICSWYSVIK